MAIFDFVLGKPCDHRVLEEISIQVEISRLAIPINYSLDQASPGFILKKNGVDITSSITFYLDPTKLKMVYITAGLTYNPAVYPPDDFTLEYYSIPDTCPKCTRRII